MEAGSEGEKSKPPEGGETRSKRQMKTAAQLEILEKTYAAEPYPSEATRADLSAQLGLSDRQLQMWFCHRRLKDRKPPPAKRPRKDSPARSLKIPEAMVGEALDEPGPEPGPSPYDHGIDPRRVVPRSGVGFQRVGGDGLGMRRYNEPSPQLATELRVIASVEAQLGEPLREDGPILGMEFDPLPPGAFGTPIETPVHIRQSAQAFEYNLHEKRNAKQLKAVKRTIHEYQFLPEQPTVRTDQQYELSHHYGLPGTARTVAPSAGCSLLHVDEQVPAGYGLAPHIPNLNLISQQDRPSNLFASGSGESNIAQRRSFLANASPDANSGAQAITVLQNPFVSSERIVDDDEDIFRVERKRKNEEARMAREVEANEKRIRKELEKQDMLRRKREEQIRKEMERQERERRKEEERMLRERQREEERFLKEQRREMARKEKFLLKESIRAEKMRQKEELRREKEAARIKAANERAIARKMAKESMEVIEDERLELMELAASSKGLPSILSLDFETLQNLDIFKDKLTAFPPGSVKLRRPFTIKPWNGSDENIGNLLMVWTFLITFADILGLWPFTLDEFVQALHDYDPRLLGEVHVALLRCIIKDIEDVARALSTALGTHQNNGFNPGGGHPQIIEGAYVWGFDISSWRCHLNALTWPEILRQFAISAGYGPHLKKRSTYHAHHDDYEVNNSENIISTLRNGAAAEKAFAVMQERGFSNPRRSRHRLTPGTVKFAAFHVLSLEGDKGLTILEVAERIQKSGLRDLTTSKTPEASIAAALSRDTKLFERVAPSTYCVRPPYRRDPADGEAILSAAREKIRAFKSGGTIGEEVDEAERDDDSGSDAVDDAEVDDLGIDINSKKEILDVLEMEKSNIEAFDTNGEGILDIFGTPEHHVETVCKDSSSILPKRLVKDKQNGGSLDVSGVCKVDTSFEQENSCIDESNPGKAWVQGLMEGEYSDLSVEERLDALVALISVAIEGNSVHTALEERLEAANALKKQMWAEMQVDKRRMKEEYLMRANYSSFVRNTSEHNLIISSVEAGQSPLPPVGRSNETATEPVLQQERLSDAQNDENYFNNSCYDGNMHMQDTAVGPENIQQQQLGYAAEKLRSQLKSYVGFRAEELYVYRSLPLGHDRKRNRYWLFTASASRNDPGCGRIFLEFHNGPWRLIDSEEGFDALLASLDIRGVRESNLHFMLQKIESSFKEAVRRDPIDTTAKSKSDDSVKKEAIEAAPLSDCNLSLDSPCSSACASDSDTNETSTTFRIELGQNEIEKHNAIKRYRDTEKWMWKDTFSSSTLSALKYGNSRCKALHSMCDHCVDIYSFEKNQCASCGQNCGSDKSELHLSEQLARFDTELRSDPNFVMRGSVSSPLRIRLLRILLALVEASVPADAFVPVWTDNHRASWGLKLHSSTSPEELLQVLTILENAVKRDYFSSSFETTGELIGSSNQPGVVASDPSVQGKAPVLPWLPKTTAAAALRLFELDSSIFYVPSQKEESQKESRNFKLQSEDAIMRKIGDGNAAETPCRDRYLQEPGWLEVGTASGVRGRPRGRGRGRSNGGKSQRNSTSIKSESGKRPKTKDNKEPRQELGWKGQARARGGRKHGRRSTRKRQKKIKTTSDIDGDGDTENPNALATEQLLMETVGDWNENETLNAEGAEDPSSSGRSPGNDEDCRANEDEYFDVVAQDDYASGPRNASGNDEFNISSDEDEENDDGDGGGDYEDYGVEYAQEDLNGEEEYADEEDSDDDEGLGNEVESNDTRKSFTLTTSSSSEYGE